MENQQSLLDAAAAAELAAHEERARQRSAEIAERARALAERSHAAHVRAGKAAAAKRWSGHAPAQATVTRRLFRVDDELLQCFGRGPMAIHRLLKATEGLLWVRRPGDGYPVSLEALKRVSCVPPAPGESSGLPAWACVRRKRGTGG